ncbi:MAG: hypothetical protein KatS3mg052_2628 [Candidatus Roseilinea sp.]|nr:MAG: hypothetical protein KatS3mg052_2628 [Candidatus Roseilinea sp.]
MLARQADGHCYVARQIIRQADERINRRADDLFGRRRCDFLDVHASGSAGHQHGAASRAVYHYAQVDFALDVGGGVNQHLAHGQALNGQGEDVLGLLFNFFERVGDLHAAGFAAPAHQHLRLDDDRQANLAGGVARLGGILGHDALGRWDAESAKDLLGLVFVEFHDPCVLSGSEPIHQLMTQRAIEQVRRALCSPNAHVRMALSPRIVSARSRRRCAVGL